MTNKYYDPGRQRAAKVQALFTRIASRYDLMNDLQSFGLHRRWKRRVVELARPRPGARALDLCCGTGDIALGLADAGAKVVGLDFTEPMLQVARARDARSRVGWVRADAQRLPAPDGLFEVVTVGYGLRNLADWEQGVREMVRVARPGGRVLVLDFGKPANPVWRSVYYAYMRLFVPLLGLVTCGSASAYSYILVSLKHYPAQAGVAAKMMALGLVNVHVVEFLGGVMSINYGEKPGSPA